MQRISIVFALHGAAACGSSAASPAPGDSGRAGTTASAPVGAAPAAGGGGAALQPSAASPAGADDSAADGGGRADKPTAGAGVVERSGGAGAAGRAFDSPLAGAGQAAPLVPVQRAGKYVWERDALSLELDPAHGARITRLAWHGQNLLTGPDVDMLNYGSTFWPSPQARWDWPPVPELDSDAYSVEVQGDTLVCASRSGMRARVSVHKRVRAAADGATLEYQLTNEDTAPASWAPWEITRVAAGGLSFFPSGERLVGAQLPVVNQGGVTWYRHDAAKLGGSGQKLSADGAEGFLAHVAGRTLFVKQFMDLPPAQQAPAPEAEIAIYAAPGYVELEPQGAYGALMPGQSTTWSVRWHLADVPPDVPIEVGSTALVQLARSLLAR